MNALRLRTREIGLDRPVEIEIKGLYSAFGEHKVLRGVDLSVGRGEVVAVVGGSGCGKTVLLNQILGQLTPDAGTIEVADHGKPDAPLVDIATLHFKDIDAIHKHWGMVFQGNALFSGSVYDNIALWLREVRHLDEGAIHDIARSVLESVGLATDNDFLTRDVNELSGGMAKRLAVARALSMDPMVVFYDEPTTGLDPSSAVTIHDLIQTTHDEHRPGRPARTTVIITHDKDLLSRLKPRILMMHDGRVFFDGPLDAFEASGSAIVRPYFDLMPSLHLR
jgi:phospholipid/cholesterol/gamma-HCH transport system ATP-binding protein